MSRILNADATNCNAAVRAWSASRIAMQDPAAAEAAGLRLDIELLQERLAEREAAVTALHAEVGKARAAGEESGRAAGRAEADTRAAEALDCLRKGAEGALALFKAEMASTERLAALLASTVLEQLFGDAAHRGEIVIGLLRHRIAELDRSAVIRIEVSRADFPDAATLATLAESLGGRFEAKASDDLAGGDCRIKLLLGAMEVGLNQQWGCLSAELAAMSEGGRA
jgi:flagellar biosynthesis/type III secretory pathway protein FliH